MPHREPQWDAVLSARCHLPGGGGAGIPQRCVQVSEALWGGGGVCGQERVVPRMGTRPGCSSARGGGSSNLTPPTSPPSGQGCGIPISPRAEGLRKDPTPPQGSGCRAGSPVAAVPRLWGRLRPAPPGPARPAPAAPRQVHSPRLARARRNRRAPLGEAPRMPRPGALLCAVLPLLLLSPAPGSGQAGERRTGSGNRTATGCAGRGSGAGSGRARGYRELGALRRWGVPGRADGPSEVPGPRARFSTPRPRKKPRTGG